MNDKLNRKGLYPICDNMTSHEAKALGFDKAQLFLPTCHISPREVRAQWTGEKRCPKRGEWFLSGSIIEAYRAPNDLSTPYHIAKLVRVKITTTTTIEVVGG